MKKALKVFLCILFFPIVLTVLILRSKKLAPKIKALLVALLWVFCIIIGASGAEDSSEPEVPSETVIMDTQQASSASVNSHMAAAASVDIASDVPEPSENPSLSFAGTLEEVSIAVQEIFDFDTEQFSVYVGDCVTLSTDIKPSGLDADSITVENSAPDVVRVSAVTIDNGLFTGTANITCDACAPGESVVTLKSADGSISSNAVRICVDTRPLINRLSLSGARNCSLEEGDSQAFSLYIDPLGTIRDTVVIENTDELVACITESAFYDTDNGTVLDFTIDAINAGETCITFSASDGKVSPVELCVSVSEKDTSPTVYTTPTGECYHFSKSCAGDNAIETTQNKAVDRNYRPCSKCA